MRVLTVNTGSSSVKLGLFAEGVRAWAVETGLPFDARELPQQAPDAVAHRIVAPLDWTGPRHLDDTALTDLRSLVPLAADHLPQALAAIQATRAAYPKIPQVGCSDSAFHHTMSVVARAVGVPQAPLRYGYHGLSCEYIVSVLEPDDARVVIAHLGHGCSMTAVRNRRSVDTTMGFTPLGGLVMSTRPGDLDPGLLLHLLRQPGVTAESLNQTLNHASGLRALSGLSGDMKTLLASPAADARFAVEVFVYSARKHLGAMTAVLGGADLVVFTGGIGEHAPALCARIAGGWPHRAIPTDEEMMLARHAKSLLGR